MLPLWFTEPILLFLGQEPQLASLAEDYMRIAQWGLLPSFLLIGLRSFLTSIEKANAVLGITIFASLLNGLLNYALIFGNWGAPRMEIEGAATASLIANIVAAVVAIWLVSGKMILAVNFLRIAIGESCTH